MSETLTCCFGFLAGFVLVLTWLEYRSWRREAIEWKEAYESILLREKQTADDRDGVKRVLGQWINRVTIQDRQIIAIRKIVDKEDGGV